MQVSVSSLWTGGRSEWTRPASPPTTDPAGTEVALLGAGASSEGAEAGAVGSPEVSATLRAWVPWEHGGDTAGRRWHSPVPACRRRGPRVRREPVRVQEWGLWRLQRLLQQVRVCACGHRAGRSAAAAAGVSGLKCLSCSRSQGGGYGDRSSGGSYRDSYDSYGKSRSEGTTLPGPAVGAQ